MGIKRKQNYKKELVNQFLSTCRDATWMKQAI